MKALLISANKVRAPFPVYPLALDYLAGGLQPMHTVRFLDLMYAQVEEAPDKAVFFCGVRIYPGTELYTMAVSKGQLSPETDLLEPVFYHTNAISSAEIEEIIKERAAGRPNWVAGSGGDMMNKVIARMYAKGYIKPVWEKLIP